MYSYRGPRGIRGPKGTAALTTPYDTTVPLKDLGAISSSTTLDTTSFGNYVFASPSSGSLTITLPNATTVGTFIVIRNTSASNSLAVAGTGLSAVSLATASGATFIWYGSAWVKF